MLAASGIGRALGRRPARGAQHAVRTRHPRPLLGHQQPPVRAQFVPRVPDRADRVTAHMAAAEEQRPHRAVQGALTGVHRAAAAPPVLEEPQLTARAQDAADLGEGPRQVSYAAQHQGDHGRVEGLALDRERLRDARDHVDGHVGAQGRGHRQLPQAALRFDGDDLRDRARIVGEVQSVARADLGQRKPFVYQDTGGQRREVGSGYEVKGGGRVGFRLGVYDRTKALVIDPVLVYSTYLGGGPKTSASVSRSTRWATPTSRARTKSMLFPTTPGAFDATFKRWLLTAYVTKLSAGGSSLVYSTYIGGSNDDFGRRHCR